MDYEKKYNEALKRARAYNTPIANRNVKAILESVFPELAESEDEKIRRELIEYLKGDLDDITTDDTDRWITWIEKQKEQKSAWSEEDEKIIDTIVSVLGQYIDYKAVSGTGTGYATPRYSKEIDWLKSIRPSWKPSEEQMTALSDIITMKRAGNKFAETRLREIYEQLKKL